MSTQLCDILSGWCLCFGCLDPSKEPNAARRLQEKTMENWDLYNSRLSFYHFFGCFLFSTLGKSTSNWVSMARFFFHWHLRFHPSGRSSSWKRVSLASLGGRVGTLPFWDCAYFLRDMYDITPKLQHDHLQENRHDRKSQYLYFLFLLKPIIDHVWRIHLEAICLRQWWSNWMFGSQNVWAWVFGSAGLNFGVICQVMRSLPKLIKAVDDEISMGINKHLYTPLDIDTWQLIQNSIADVGACISFREIRFRRFDPRFLGTLIPNCWR